MKKAIRFILNAEVTEAEKQDGKVYLKTEGAKDQESTVDPGIVLVAVGRVSVTSTLELDKIGIEADPRGCIGMDDHYNSPVQGIKNVGDVAFGPMLAHRAEEEGIAAVEYIKTGYGHVN